MEVRRTAPVKLIVPDECRDDLHDSARQFLHCANRAAEFCWDDDSYTNCITANSTARDALYAELREETDLTANLVQEAIRRAVQATTGCVERWKQGKRVSQPEFTSWSMVYDKRSANIGLRYAHKRHHRLRSSPTSRSGDAPVDVRITGGIVNGTSHQPLAGD